MLHTHTRPEPGQPWKARGRKKRTHDGQTAKTAQGGKGTDGPPEPTYTAKRTWQKQRTHLNPTTRYGEARGERLGTNGELVDARQKTKQLVKKQDPVPRPTVRAIIPCTGTVVKSCPNWHKTAFKFHRIRCTICCTSPDNHQKEEYHTCKTCACLIHMSWHDALALQTLLQKTEVSGCSEQCHLKERRSLGSLGQQEQRVIVKWCRTVRPTVAIYLDELLN